MNVAVRAHGSSESGRGQPHSKTVRDRIPRDIFRKVWGAVSSAALTLHWLAAQIVPSPARQRNGASLRRLLRKALEYRPADIGEKSPPLVRVIVLYWRIGHESPGSMGRPPRPNR